jgi:putative DNA primase/helicase
MKLVADTAPGEKQTPKPGALLVTPEAIPEALGVEPRWVLWHYELRDGKWTKVPFTVTGTAAFSTKAATWTTLKTALQCYEAGGFDGVGFVLGDGWAGVDFDDVRSSETGELVPKAAEVVAALASYTEVSPSRSGVKVFLRGKIPEGGNRKKGFFGPSTEIEMYDHGRYFAVTGKPWPNTPGVVAERTVELAALHAEVFGTCNGTSNGNGATSIIESHLHLKPKDELKRDDEQVLAAVREDPKKAKDLKLLWAGEIKKWKNNDSAADFTLATLLASASRDPIQIERLMRNTLLCRPKWNEPRASVMTPGATVTYLRLTIEKALIATKKVTAPVLSAIDPRPVIDITERDGKLLLAEMTKSLGQQNNLPTGPVLFQTGSRLSRIIEDGESARLETITARGTIFDIVTNAARYVSRDRRKTERILHDVSPPTDVLDAVIATQRGFPELLRVVHAPVFAPDGTLGTAKGYFKAARVWHQPRATFVLSPVPDKPSGEEIAIAREALLEPLQDFPFDMEADRVHMLALILAPFIRELIDGPTPLHLIEKTDVGSGAGFLVGNGIDHRVR